MLYKGDNDTNLGGYTERRYRLDLRRTSCYSLFIVMLFSWLRQPTLEIYRFDAAL